MSNTDTFDLRIAQYHRLEAKIDEIETEQKEKLRPYKEAREKLRALMLGMLNDSGQESAKTSAGTVYKTTRSSASLEDPEAFKRHVIGSENWDLLDWKANLTAAQDFASANDGELPPGVKNGKD